MNYVLASVMFAALGLWLHAIYRWWHQHLQKLARAHDIERRRQLAARHFAGVALLLVGAFLGTVFSVLQFAPVGGLFLVVGLAFAGVPNMFWWQRHWASLKALGYGWQSVRTSTDATSAIRVRRVFWGGAVVVSAVEFPMAGYVFGVVGLRHASLTLLISYTIVCSAVLAAWVFFVRRAARQH